MTSIKTNMTDCEVLLLVEGVRSSNWRLRFFSFVRGFCLSLTWFYMACFFFLLSTIGSIA